MAFRKLSDFPNDCGLAIDIEANRIGRWNGSEFVVIADPAAKELPDLPEEDGTYNLTVTIEEGEATLSWEAAGGGE